MNEYAWFDSNTYDVGETYAHQVSQKRANGLGLFDMHGNVYEWCSDWYGDYSDGSVTDPGGAGQGTNRVFRGGSWFSTPGDCRAAFRGWISPEFRGCILGFRLVSVSK